MLCGLLCASVASAQTSVSQEFLTASEDEGHRTEISISAGLDVSKYSEKPSAESVKNRLGYNFGIGVNVPMFRCIISEVIAVYVCKQNCL